MNNTLILKLIKNNINEIGDLIIHFQNEEDDLISGFPLIESRLNSLNKDMQLLKSCLGEKQHRSTPLLNQIVSQEQLISTDQDKKIENQFNEQKLKNNSVPNTIKEHSNHEIIHKIESVSAVAKDKPHETEENNLQEEIKISKLKDIQSIIGINDQFLFIRELFNSNTEEYRSAINYINSINDYSKIISHFKQTYEWDSDDVTPVQFFDLIKRKFE